MADPPPPLIDRPEHGTYLLPDLLADTNSGHNIIATVYLEWLSMYSASGPVEVQRGGGCERVWEPQMAAGGGRYRGIRYISATHPDQGQWGSPVLRPEGMLKQP